MIIIQNLILCINEKITLPRVGFEPVTVRCLKNDKDLARMKPTLRHRATRPEDNLINVCLVQEAHDIRGIFKRSKYLQVTPVIEINLYQRLTSN